VGSSKRTPRAKRTAIKPNITAIDLEEKRRLRKIKRKGKGRGRSVREKLIPKRKFSKKKKKLS